MTPAIQGSMSAHLNGGEHDSKLVWHADLYRNSMQEVV